MRIVLDERDFATLVGGGVLTKRTPGVAGGVVEMILSDIGWFAMEQAIRQAKDGAAGMSHHDYMRYLVARDCDRDDPHELADAVRGLQSTDDPRLNNLHDELLARYTELGEEMTR